MKTIISELASTESLPEGINKIEKAAKEILVDKSRAVHLQLSVSDVQSEIDSNIIWKTSGGQCHIWRWMVNTESDIPKYSLVNKHFYFNTITDTNYISTVELNLRNSHYFREGDIIVPFSFPKTENKEKSEPKLVEPKWPAPSYEDIYIVSKLIKNLCTNHFHCRSFSLFHGDFSVSGKPTNEKNKISIIRDRVFIGRMDFFYDSDNYNSDNIVVNITLSFKTSVHSETPNKFYCKVFNHKMYPDDLMEIMQKFNSVADLYGLLITRNAYEHSITE